MFYHRVLPPPLHPSVSTRRSSSIDNSNLLTSSSTDESSMTTVDSRPSSFSGHRGLRSFAYNEQEQIHQHNNIIIRNSELSSPILLRSSIRNLRKNTNSPTSKPDQDTGNRLPSISREGELAAQDSPAHVCLCQPDPKVPRPRNAFILFRQHHQAAVVAQNPGLANPDISKIIGDAWRASSSETKNHWKKLADEEKVRHQKLYPDYRYQPRRAGRNSLSNSVAVDPETQLCLKCGGKTMQTYTNLPTPANIISPRPAPTGASMIGNAILSRGSRYIGSPSYPPSPADSRGFPPANSPSSISTRQRDSIPQHGPDPKKRRYDGSGSPASRSATMGMTSSFSQPGRRPSIQHPEILTRGQGAHAPRTQMLSGHPDSAPGPALAPLQIDKSREAASHGRAIEAMVMSIPALMKIKVLAKISPPLPVPGPTSPPHDTRGALIAVEGSDEEAIKLTTNYLKDYLERDGDYRVRIMLKPVPTAFESNTSWLDTIRAYHDESIEIIKYITTNLSLEEDQAIESTSRRTSRVTHKSNPQANEKDGEDEHMSSPVSSPIHTGKASGLFPRPHRPIPIVIAPLYQLSLTNLAASQIPINDEYSPTDHWQWMATLWRGIIGPDVTIDIQNPTSLHSSGPNDTTSPNQMGAAPMTGVAYGRGSAGSPVAGKDVHMMGASNSNDGTSGITGQPSTSARNIPIVDVRLQDARAVFLRGEAGSKVSETGLRRMGFEVSEWLRDVEGRERDRAKRERTRS